MTYDDDEDENRATSVKSHESSERDLPATISEKI